MEEGGKKERRKYSPLLQPGNGPRGKGGRGVVLRRGQYKMGLGKRKGGSDLCKEGQKGKALINATERKGIGKRLQKRLYKEGRDREANHFL